MTADITTARDAEGWERTLYAFLAEKERRSGSRRTPEAYSRMLEQFFGKVGKTPDQVTSQEVFAYAHGRGLSGREPSSVTVGARIACISSFYRFLRRMDIVASNPCEMLERPKAQPAPPRGLSAEQVRRLLQVIPRTPSGLRDRAIILTFVLTGRRRAEVLSLKAGDLSEHSGKAFYIYRGKGGKRGRRELPQPAVEAIRTALAAYGFDLESLPSGAPLWPNGQGGGVTSATFYANLRRYQQKVGLPLTGVHVFRHTAAKLRRDGGESVEAVSQFLDHSSLAVTSVYLRRLEGVEDHGWQFVASVIGA